MMIVAKYWSDSNSNQIRLITVIICNFNLRNIPEVFLIFNSNIGVRIREEAEIIEGEVVEIEIDKSV